MKANWLLSALCCLFCFFCACEKDTSPPWAIKKYKDRIYMIQYQKGNGGARVKTYIYDPQKAVWNPGVDKKTADAVDANGVVVSSGGSSSSQNSTISPQIGAHPAAVPGVASTLAVLNLSGNESVDFYETDGFSKLGTITQAWSLRGICKASAPGTLYLFYAKVANSVVTYHLSTIDVAGRRITDTVQMDAAFDALNKGQRGRFMAASPDGSLLYIGSVSGLAVYGIAERKVLKTIVFGDNSGSRVVEVSPDGSLIAATGNSKVFLVDAATQTLSTSVNVLAPDTAMAFHPAGNKLYVIANLRAVSIIDTQTFTVTNTVSFPGLIYDIALVSDASVLAVHDLTNQRVYFLDTGTGQLQTDFLNVRGDEGAVASIMALENQ